MLLACLNEVEFAAENLSAQGAEQLTGRHSITSFFFAKRTSATLFHGLWKSSLEQRAGTAR